MEDTGFRLAEPKDDSDLKKLMNVPMRTRGLWLSFEREPSFFAGQAVIATEPYTAVREDEHGELIAAYSNGARQVWLDGEQTKLRYTCDMRIAYKARGTKIMLKAFSEYKKQFAQEGEKHFAQFIVLEGNNAALAAVRSNKPGMATYYEIDRLHTLTLSGFKTKQQHPNLALRQAHEVDAKLMNDFAASMSQYYQALPVYDFTKLGSTDPYYSGLKFEDFVLAFEGDTLVGMAGVWNQKHLKQTRVAGFDTWLKIVRPFYNLVAPWLKLLRVPAKGQSFDYRVLHSLLCDPQRLDVCDALIQAAFDKAVSQGAPAVSFTFAETDPRHALLERYVGETLVGLFGYYSFERDPRPELNSKLIPYAECGRI